MRYLQGTGEIGDSLLMAVVSGGVVGEAGRGCKYNPVNPCDIGPVAPVPQELALFLASNIPCFPMVVMSDAYYPMTFHQRQYKWPDEGVGPVRLMGSVGVSKPPVEVASGQDMWPLSPVQAIVPYALEFPNIPSIQKVALDTETVIPQRGNSTREFWTLYKTAPWTTNAFIRNVQMEGGSYKFFIRGVTRDAAGAPLGGVTLRGIIPSGFAAGLPGNPIFAEVISDVSGNFEFIVGSQRYYEIHAYHEGLEVGGITVDHLMADVVVDIYCTQPGVAPSGGGGAYRVVGSSVIRRLR